MYIYIIIHFFSSSSSSSGSVLPVQGRKKKSDKSLTKVILFVL